MKTASCSDFKKLLIVGPKPPPIGGSPLTVQAIIDELAKSPSVKLSLVNTSPIRDVRKKMTGFNFEKVWRVMMFAPKYVWEIRKCDAVLVFSNNLFALTAIPFLLLLARMFKKPFYMKPVGGDLDLYLESLPGPLRKFLQSNLRNMDGILVQTQLLKRSLTNIGCSRALYLPGFRTKPSTIQPQKRESYELRLIFLAHIAREKGPLILLEALQVLERSCQAPISCDFYGPIHDEIREDFLSQLELTPSAHYCGVAEPGSGTSLISAYDVLVLPTYFVCEGHTGVLIEAMHAGIPVISTWHRSVPELVTNGENGILVPTRESQALAEAIRQMAVDRSLRERMGLANSIRGEFFRTEKIVAQMLNIIFPTMTIVQ